MIAANPSCLRPSASLGRMSRVTLQVQAKRGSVHKAPKPQLHHSKKGPNLDVDHDKMYLDGSYTPKICHGPVKLVDIKGKGRGLIASADISPGDLLMVSAPVSVVRAPLGMRLRPKDLSDALASQTLSPADKQRLSLLMNDKAVVQLEDFFRASEQAAKQELKASQPTKGFGNAKSPSGGSASLSMNDAAFKSLVKTYSWGNEYSEIGAVACRGEESQAFIGLWPEAALLNHSCAPNTVHMVVAERMLVRAVTNIPKGAEITTSYLDRLGGGPLSLRRKTLSDAYKFNCNCPRCKYESELPTELQQHLEAMHSMLTGTEESSQGGGDAAEGSDKVSLIAKVKAAIAGDDEDAAETVLKLRKELQEKVDKLEALLVQHQIPDLYGIWVRASAYGFYELLYTCSDDDTTSDETLPARLAPLADVFAPCSDVHLYLTLEWLARVGDKHGDKLHPDIEKAAKSCLQTHLRRYGKVSDGTLTALMKCRSGLYHYLGRVNLGGVYAQQASKSA